MGSVYSNTQARKIPGSNSRLTLILDNLHRQGPCHSPAGKSREPQRSQHENARKRSWTLV